MTMAKKKLKVGVIGVGGIAGAVGQAVVLDVMKAKQMRRRHGLVFLS